MFFHRSFADFREGSAFIRFQVAQMVRRGALGRLTRGMTRDALLLTEADDTSHGLVREYKQQRSHAQQPVPTDAAESSYCFCDDCLTHYFYYPKDD